MAEQYLDLLKRCLTNTLAREPFDLIGWPTGWLPQRLRRWITSHPFRLVRRSDPQRRREGRDWPLEGETMVGLSRLDHLQQCIRTLVVDGVPGDLIETGVWRGGSSIFMRAALKAYGASDRTVWVADSFQGLPKPDADRYPADQGSTLWTQDALAVSVDEVRANFAKYGMLNQQVRFLVGWFRDTLPTAPVERLALMRLDGDLYESTMDALRALYPKLSVGGYAIIDDYGAIPACRQAVEEYRSGQGITEPMTTIDWTCAVWRRAR